MARGGIKARVKTSEYRKLEKELASLGDGAAIDGLARRCMNRLGGELLRHAILNTPVGQYPPSSGKLGGTLRRGWTSETYDEAKEGSKAAPSAADISEHIKRRPLKRAGQRYRLELINPVEYAPYVEYGHRTRGGKGWAQGRFMLTRAESTVQREAQRMVDSEVKRFIEERMR